MNKKFPWSIVFDSCPHNKTYNVYKEEYAKANVNYWQAAMLQANVVGSVVPTHRDHNCNAHGGKGHTLENALAPLVCKQMYQEVTSTAWRTNTFSFDNGNNFWRFLKSPLARPDLIHFLALRLDPSACRNRG
ncbi:hypothetical protein BDU57DRAFT_537233 [Ampelomyces quisqualis]|uniref:Uncharacterized protein n=1 Tax=Ampelomyces quisqualis TaxID=50730 RepID=A0A6A5QRW4_AMPQU|nr:hypothetical protein BDU57DRAFT_537233 [Ampelomyces quisqualis]